MFLIDCVIGPWVVKQQRTPHESISFMSSSGVTTAGDNRSAVSSASLKVRTSLVSFVIALAHR
jgi:hypothetical protein